MRWRGQAGHSWVRVEGGKKWGAMELTASRLKGRKEDGCHEKDSGWFERRWVDGGRGCSKPQKLLQFNLHEEMSQQD